MKQEYGEQLNDIEEQIAVETGGMTQEDLQAIVRKAIIKSIEYIDDEVSPNRATATEYYRGDAFGNEEDGRSSVVSMDVRDTVSKIMPALLRTFFGTDKVVSFSPRGEEDQPFAEMATDYVNYVLTEDNNLFLELQSCWQDALVRKVGILKFYYEDTDETVHSMTGINDMELAALEGDPETEVEVVASSVELDEMGNPTTDEIPTYTVRVRYQDRQGRVRVKALPPEEFLIDRMATKIEDATYCGHRKMATVSELIKMGYDKDLVESKATSQDELMFNKERIARDPDEITNYRDDEAMKRVLYIESYIRADKNGDGIAELRKVCTMGDDYEIVYHEEVEMAPFATFCPSPESHVFFGQSMFDLVGDIQLIKSNIMRNMLDSLSMSVHPRVGVVEGAANVDDVLNSEIGGIIRMTNPGSVVPFALPFVGKEAFPMLQYLDKVREDRTGISKQSQGLDSDSLQSTTATAVSAVMKGAQSQIEMIARIFAETGMRQLFSGVLKLLIANQDKERIVRLRGVDVPIDVRPWNADMDVQITIPLGSASEQEKLDSLSAIIQKQEQILSQLGPNNGIVNIENYRNAIQAQIEIAGFKNVSDFITTGPIQPPPPPPPQGPSPQEQLLEVQKLDIEADIRKKAAELELRRQEMLRDDDFRHDKLEADIMVKAAEIKAKYNSTMDVAQIKAMIDVDREALRAQNQVVQ